MHPYTINTAANMNAALAAGVDGMFTNFSDVLIGILGPRKAVGLQGALDAKNSHDACLARNAEGGVGGAVPATLSLTLGAAGLVRRVHPGRGARTTRAVDRPPTSSPSAGDAHADDERSAATS